MRIALVGAGAVGLRLATEWCKSEAEVIILTAETRLTDYSIEDLKMNLDDCDVVVSTLSGPSEFYIFAHSNLRAACSASRRYKHRIPSERNINMEDFPNQPMFSSAKHEDKNYFARFGPSWAMNHCTKIFDIYGDGLQKVTLASLGDVARAVLAPVTHLAGQTLTYRDLFELIRAHDRAWKLNAVTLSEVLDAICKGLKANNAGVAVHQMRILGFTNANHIHDEKALVWGTGVLHGLYATRVKKLLEKANTGLNQ
ncbi:hypothetical protein BDV38DRAFT_275434 [Aspergillus pseudotamarii]|uniref:Uncharacterized protein n=1 Tax=Aspergillus pseudotamarii TaxID=132259 RepID=A0A5N6SBD4_ASPPS|nr:uncharacterized protein BDV38DRAFT_275434 [Aspergillus pseudotamarii]KAE8132026.1 hypothetical protein BDV38DRAFT_275434 [Aspergillus pseudotamarii]